jgi:hypothetical protein
VDVPLTEGLGRGGCQNRETAEHRLATDANPSGLRWAPSGNERQRLLTMVVFILDRTSTVYASVLAPVRLHGQKVQQRARLKAKEQTRGHCTAVAA